MNDFRYRPSGHYIQEADWQKLYILTEHWISNLQFYKDDLRFLHHLIDKYLLWLSKKENVAKVQDIEVNVLKVDKQCRLLIEKTKKHLHHLAELIENPFAYDSHEFRTEHEMLENELTQFLKDFRKNRKQVFAIKDHIIQGEEMVRQLNVIPK